MAFTEENQNFFRLYYVLNEFGTKALNELLRWAVQQAFPRSPAMTLSTFLALPQVQKDLCPPRTRGCLDPMQKDLLYPCGAPSMTVDYGDLDITLLTTLLKNLTVFSGILTQPGNPHSSRRLWTIPTESDQRSCPLEANVVLLKNKRNYMAHSRIPCLPTPAFESHFNQVKSYLMNIMRQVGSVAFVEDDIEHYRNSPLSPKEFQEMAAKLLDSVEASQGLKDEDGRLKEEQAQMKEEQAQMKTWTICGVILLVIVIVAIIIWAKVNMDHQEKELEKLKAAGTAVLALFSIAIACFIFYLLAYF